MVNNKPKDSRKSNDYLLPVHSRDTMNSFPIFYNGDKP